MLTTSVLPCLLALAAAFEPAPSDNRFGDLPVQWRTPWIAKSYWAHPVQSRTHLLVRTHGATIGVVNAATGEIQRTLAPRELGIDPFGMRVFLVEHVLVGVTPDGQLIGIDVARGERAWIRRLPPGIDRYAVRDSLKVRALGTKGEAEISYRPSAAYKGKGTVAKIRIDVHSGKLRGASVPKDEGTEVSHRCVSKFETVVRAPVLEGPTMTGNLHCVMPTEADRHLYVIAKNGLVSRDPKTCEDQWRLPAIASAVVAKNGDLIAWSVAGVLFRFDPAQVLATPKRRVSVSIDATAKPLRGETPQGAIQHTNYLDSRAGAREAETRTTVSVQASASYRVGPGYFGTRGCGARKIVEIRPGVDHYDVALELPCHRPPPD